MATSGSTPQIIARRAQHGFHLADPLMLPVLHLLDPIDHIVQIDANVPLILLSDPLA